VCVGLETLEKRGHVGACKILKRHSYTGSVHTRHVSASYGTYCQHGTVEIVSVVDIPQSNQYEKAYALHPWDMYGIIDEDVCIYA